MIEGLKIQLVSDELEAHLQTRIAYHEQKMLFYEGQVRSLREGGVGVRHRARERQSLEGSVKQHKDRAAFFSFIAEHLIPDETYQLDESDLGRLEIASRYYG